MSKKTFAKLQPFLRRKESRKRRFCISSLTGGHGGRMRLKMAAGLLFLIMVASAAQANDKSIRFGIMPIATYYTINDPLGPTQSKTEVTPLSAVAIFDSGRDARFFVHAFASQFTVDASPENIGQKVKIYGINGSYQTLFRMTRVIRPWIGLGLGYASESYQNRHNITAGGYLPAGQPFPDRHEDNYTALVNLSQEWQFNRNYDIGLHVQFEKPFTSGGAQALRLGIYLVY